MPMRGGGRRGQATWFSRVLTMGCSNSGTVATVVRQNCEQTREGLRNESVISMAIMDRRAMKVILAPRSATAPSIKCCLELQGVYHLAVDLNRNSESRRGRRVNAFGTLKSSFPAVSPVGSRRRSPSRCHPTSHALLHNVCHHVLILDVPRRIIDHDASILTNPSSEL